MIFFYIYSIFFSFFVSNFCFQNTAESRTFAVCLFGLKCLFKVLWAWICYMETIKSHINRILYQTHFVKWTLWSDGGSHHIKTSTFICFTNPWSGGLYMIGISTIKELKKHYNFWNFLLKNDRNCRIITTSLISSSRAAVIAESKMNFLMIFSFWVFSLSMLMILL